MSPKLVLYVPVALAGMLEGVGVDEARQREIALRALRDAVVLQEEPQPFQAGHLPRLVERHPPPFRCSQVVPAGTRCKVCGEKH